MYLPLLDAKKPFSPLVWLRDALRALILYLYVFFASARRGLLAQSATQNAGVQGASYGKYLIGVGIGDITGYVSPSTTAVSLFRILPLSNSPIVETNMMARAVMSHQSA